jgi:hypothetical protein
VRGEAVRAGPVEVRAPATVAGDLRHMPMPCRKIELIFGTKISYFIFHCITRTVSTGQKPLLRGKRAKDFSMKIFDLTSPFQRDIIRS